NIVESDNFQEPQLLEPQLSPVAGRPESEITQNNTTQTVESNEPESPKLRYVGEGHAKWLLIWKIQWKSNELNQVQTRKLPRVVTLIRRMTNHPDVESNRIGNTVAFENNNITLPTQTPNIVTSKELFQYRQDNLVYFLDSNGCPCDNGSRALKKLKQITVCRVGNLHCAFKAISGKP
ncbi:hypothetical protein KQX54_000753, partial [Cotesia glomerata]